MGLSAERLAADLAALAAIEPAFARGLAAAGHPPPRQRARGHETLLRTIVGQQVSVASADAMWRRLVAAGLTVPDAIAAASDEALRAAGLSRQKGGYARHLSEQVTSGAIELSALPEDDEAAIAALTRIKGIGRWSAEIYLLFAEGRGDIWPAGDLAVQIEIGILLGLEARPSEKLTRTLAEPWRPYRGAAAVFAWHHYGHRLSGRGGDKAPV
ncbi:MAG: glycosylase [Sphingomonas bacterium]|nr:DNA-3-methyladenine glycosylase 2 family protein [Sphingomonas bacterium]MDB5690758.1 glycosylase [Sphingomonas bacterium]